MFGVIEERLAPAIGVGQMHQAAIEGLDNDGAARPWSHDVNRAKVI
jgi:hypothetical protein